MTGYYKRSYKHRRCRRRMFSGGGTLAPAPTTTPTNDVITELDYSGAGLTELPPLPPTLKHLYCYKNQLTALPPLPPTLIELNCVNNNLTTLPLLPPTLTRLYCSENQITELPRLPPTLKVIDCDDNQLSVLPSLPQTLTHLYCSNNQLTALPPLPPYLKYLSCTNNQLTALPSLPLSLLLINSDNNQLTALPSLPPTLQHLSCNNNQITVLPPLPPTLNIFRYKNNPVEVMQYVNNLPLLQQGITNEWEFKKNTYPYSPPYIHNTNPFLIHYETHYKIIGDKAMPFEYPVITIPKGTMLYTYSVGPDRNNYIYNLHEPNATRNSLKFFYPVPYAAHGVKNDYTHCNIVYLTDDVKLAALVGPSPVSRPNLRIPNDVPVTHSTTGLNYYNNKLTGMCPNFEFDLCLSDELMDSLNLQGYIAIPVEDSITCGYMWRTILSAPPPHLPASIIRQFVYKSNVLPYDCERNSAYPALGYVFGVPEIVLNPIKTSVFKNKVSGVRTISDVVNLTAFRDIKQIEASLLCYNMIASVAKEGIKDYLDGITGDLVENTQNPISHLYRPKMNPLYFYVRDHITSFDELTADNVNFEYTYAHASDEIIPETHFCAFMTPLYFKYIQGIDVFKAKEHSSGGGSGRRRKTYKRKNDKRRRKTYKRKYKGGQQMESQPSIFMTTDAASTAITNVYTKPIDLKPDTTTAPPAPHTAATTTTKTPILEMTKNNIPILYF